MKKNIGTWDALLRITFGLAGLAWTVSRMARWPYRPNGFTRFILWMSAMKVAEGVTRFCPMLFAFGVNSEGITIRWKNPGKQQTTSQHTPSLPSEEAKEEHRTSVQKQNARHPARHHTGQPIRARQLGKQSHLQ